MALDGRGIEDAFKRLVEDAENTRFEGQPQRSAVNDYDDSYDEDDGDSCPSCGGEGITEYLDDPGSWGEDCPSEKNHFVTCSNCCGTGLRKDCNYQ